MQFVLTKEHVYSWPVTINPPDPQYPGQVLEQKFNMSFRYMPLDQAEALDAEIEALPPKQQAVRQHDLLRRVCIGWDNNVVDDAKPPQPIPFSAEMLEAAITLSWWRVGVYTAYRQSISGRAAQLGN